MCVACECAHTRVGGCVNVCTPMSLGPCVGGLRAPVRGVFGRLCICRVRPCVRVCASACARVPLCRGRERQLGLSRGRAVSTELIVEGAAGEPPGRRARDLFNKSSVGSLRGQPAEGTGERWLCAREVGLPPAPHAPFIMPSAGGVLRLGRREVSAAAAAAAAAAASERTSKDGGVSMGTSGRPCPAGWVKGFLVQRKRTLR